MNIKKKAKDFVKDHSSIIVASGVALGTGFVIASTYACGYMRGFELGGRVGFHGTIKWFDETFDDVDLAGLWKTWSEANPDKVV